ncbi:sarcalumenin isoform X3 [Drosophila pseudoobscura]|uniref:Sarcalumenin isoform X3 n=1 Tax=Drosophila pseudoobscura pseudoobscura TaxID=46245 RepID=A0A6I8VNI2_DROPS|nr:sarcalumenin isoform X3 [Drosophila pseudoobscura]
MGRLTIWFLLGLTLLAVSDHVGFVNADVGPSESECRPYIERAINELKTDGVKDGSGELQSDQPRRDDDDDDDDGGIDAVDEKETVEIETVELDSTEDAISANDIDGDGIPDDEDDDIDGDGIPNDKDDDIDGDGIPNEDDDDMDGDGVPNEDDDDIDGDGVPNSKDEDIDGDGKVNHEDEDLDGDGVRNEKDEDLDGDGKANTEDEDLDGDGVPNDKDDDLDGDGILNEHDNDVDGDGVPNERDDDDSQADDDDDDDDDDDKAKVKKRSKREVDAAPVIDIEAPPSPAEEFPIEEEIVKEESVEVEAEPEPEPEPEVEAVKEQEPEPEPVVQEAEKEPLVEEKEEEKPVEQAPAKEESAEEAAAAPQEPEAAKEDAVESEETQDEPQADVAPADADADDDEDDTKPEDELLWEGTIPENRRSRQHITELLLLDEEFNAREKATDNVAEIILKDIKRIYENAIKPLETLYKYRDLSNRHFSDPEIFSKPLVLFMGPWSGGKSSILNYLTDNEYTPNSLRTGAEPSPAYFNILMWGNETEVLDGTQLAADYTFSGLQKFGQGLEERLRGLKMKSKLLEKVNIVEIPGILEVRKQVSRVFPFNDACQWFIDRADIIFLVYDPAKLDVGPETEAILDQLKGREYQTRIILNKADTVHPEELLRVQGALIWNISPLMSSAQPPLMYTTSLWTHPYQDGAPARLLLAQERAFLRDLRTAIDKRIEHKIASARRFAVRVRNHAKMVDCYLNTYFNHKTLFGNKKRISDDIIDHPQNYHIYEGLSTLTNISRYDLPDPEVYRDFFRLNPLYEFKKLTETCTYFRGCPITKLDQAISYELPELAGKYKKMSEAALANIEKQQQQALEGQGKGTQADPKKTS